MSDLQVEAGERVLMTSQAGNEIVTVKEVFPSGRISIKENKYTFKPNGWQRFKKDKETAHTVRKLYKLKIEGKGE